MRVPNSDRAVIDDAKVRDYLLSPSHPVGRFKSVFFAALGFSQADWQVRGILRGPSGRQAEIVTVWLVANGLDFPHFVTAFPG